MINQHWGFALFNTGGFDVMGVYWNQVVHLSHLCPEDVFFSILFVSVLVSYFHFLIIQPGVFISCFVLCFSTISQILFIIQLWSFDVMFVLCVSIPLVRCFHCSTLTFYVMFCCVCFNMIYQLYSQHTDFDVISILFRQAVCFSTISQIILSLFNTRVLMTCSVCFSIVSQILSIIEHRFFLYCHVIFCFRIISQILSIIEHQGLLTSCSVLCVSVSLVRYFPLFNTRVLTSCSVLCVSVSLVRYFSLFNTRVILFII